MGVPDPTAIVFALCTVTVYFTDFNRVLLHDRSKIDMPPAFAFGVSFWRLSRSPEHSGENSAPLTSRR